MASCCAAVSVRMRGGSTPHHHFSRCGCSRKAHPVGLHCVRRQLPVACGAAPDGDVRRLSLTRRTTLWAAGIAQLAAASTRHPAYAAQPTEVELEEFADDESGFSVQIPKGWELETPGGRYEYHAPKDYGGKRIIIKREFLGKTKTLDLKLLGTAEEYAKKLAYAEGEGANTGTKAEVLSFSEAADGRIYFVEFRINSFQPQHVWVVAGAGLGQSPGARKFSNRQLITVTGKMSEDELAKDPQGGELLQRILSSFTFTDKPLPTQ